MVKWTKKAVSKKPQVRPKKIIPVIQQDKPTSQCLKEIKQMESARKLDDIKFDKLCTGDMILCGRSNLYWYWQRTIKTDAKTTEQFLSTDGYWRDELDDSCHFPSAKMADAFHSLRISLENTQSALKHAEFIVSIGHDKRALASMKVMV